MDRAGIYIHIPFCQSKCLYCDYCSFTGHEALFADYTLAVAEQMELERPAWKQAVFDTLFIGGGTPTLLSSDQLISLRLACRQRLGLRTDAEATCEANPGTVTPESLHALRQGGLNRLSLGIQSFDDEELALLGRIHDRDTALAAFAGARDAGFDNISLDLIFGLPFQTTAIWEKNLNQALALEPEHLSLYALSVEPRTPLADQITRGALPAPDDDLSADMYELAQDLLRTSGYLQYEISNWARRTPEETVGSLPRLACRHNIHYWQNDHYLGLGVAAHSWDGYRRYSQMTSPEEYIRLTMLGQDTVAMSEAVDRDCEMDETMILGLRLAQGISWERFKARFGSDIREVYAQALHNLKDTGLLEVDEKGIRLTERGYLVGNRVFEAFLR